MRRRHARGQGMVEYALILVLVAVALVGALGAFTSELDTAYAAISAAIP